MTLKKSLYWTVVVVGFGNFLLWVPMAVVDIIQGQYAEANPAEETRLSILIGIIMGCGVVPLIMAIVATVALRKLHRTHDAALKQQSIDRLLHLAADRGGRLTVVESSTALDISIAQANDLLSFCVKERLAELQVSASGVLVYRFTQFIPDDEKSNAETV